MCKYLKHIYTLIPFLLLFASNLSADMIELKNGQMLEAVIVSEDAASYTARMDVGTISIPKENVVQVSQFEDDMNQTLIESWSGPTPSQKKTPKDKKGEAAKTIPPSKTSKQKEIRYIRFEDQWLTEEAYQELKEKRTTTWREKMEAQKAKLQELAEEKNEDSLIEDTRELIIQGAQRRSPEANRTLESFEWKHQKTDHFLVFYQNDETKKIIREKAEDTLRQIALDLDIEKEVYGYLTRPIEIFVIEDKNIWKTALQGKYLSDNPNAFSKIYKREIFLFVEDKRVIDIALPHEISHILLQIFTELNFSKDTKIPLWLDEGFANYQGSIISPSVAKTLINASIRSGNHYKLPEVLIMNEYPKTTDSKVLFYAEATKIIEFILQNHGRDVFLEFITNLLREYNRLLSLKVNLQKKDGRQIFDVALDNSVLGKEYASLSIFEENWLKNIYK